MSKIWRGAIAALPLLAMASAAGAEERSIIVLDASGSMWSQVGGRPKLEIAREALRRVLPSLPVELELGLMSYGHREKASCEDIELLVPPAPGTAGAIVSAAERLRFLGRTPLAAAVSEAARSLDHTGRKATVILVTDGVETCSADPCAVAERLEREGVDFTVHVVGFGLTAGEGGEVACLAGNTGGRYLHVSDAAGLEQALAAALTAAASAPAPAPDPAGEQATLREPEPSTAPAASMEQAAVPEPEPDPAPAAPEQATPLAQDPAPAPAAVPAPESLPAASRFNFMPKLVLGEDGAAAAASGQSWVVHEAAAGGGRGGHVATGFGRYEALLEAGDYVVTARLGEAVVERRITIGEDAPAEPVFVLDAGTLVIHPRPGEGADVAGGAKVVIDHPGDGTATYYGDTRAVLPAGEQKVRVRIGSGEVSQTIRLAAGETVERDIVVGVGRVLVNARYAAGGDRVEASGLSFDVFRAARESDGSRRHVAGAVGADGTFDLPTGDYVLVARLGQASVETPFNIRAGETRGVDAVLGAGILSVSAPGSSEIAVFSAAPDARGNRQAFGTSSSGSHQATLPAGDYAVVVRRNGNGAVTEMRATVRAGERTELELK